MKKIIGIITLTLVLAVSFFNMASVVTANQNVDLASIIQNASADDEAAGGGKYAYSVDYVESGSYEIPGGENGTCTVTWGIAGRDCIGSGRTDCQPLGAIVSNVSC